MSRSELKRALQSLALFTIPERAWSSRNSPINVVLKSSAGGTPRYFSLASILIRMEDIIMFYFKQIIYSKRLSNGSRGGSSWPIMDCLFQVIISETEASFWIFGCFLIFQSK